MLNYSPFSSLCVSEMVVDFHFFCMEFGLMMMMIFNMLSQSKVHKGNHRATAGWPAPHAKERVPRFCPAGGTGLNLSSA